MSKRFVLILCSLVLFSCLVNIRFSLVEVKAPDGYPVHNLNTGFDYTTIQAAIDAPETTNGDMILVDTGVYYESVVVSKAIFLLGENRETTIIDGNGALNVLAIASNGVSVSNFTVQHSNGNPGWGGGGLVVCGAASNIRISGIIARDNTADWGVHLTPNSHSITIKNTIITNNSRGGLLLNTNWNISVHDNTVSSSNNGILLMNSDNNSIHHNTIRDNKNSGILVNSGNANYIAGNNISGNTAGFLIGQSTNNTISGNRMTNNIFNFGTGLNAVLLSHFLHTVDSSNTVDGKPVYYLVNEKNREIPKDAGCVTIINSTGITVRDLNLTHNVEGVMMVFASNSTVENVTVQNNAVGINLLNSSDITISNCRATHSGYTLIPNGGGIGLSFSRNNTLTNNEVSDNIGVGISITASSKNILRNNSMDNNSLNFIAIPGSDPVPPVSSLVNDVDTSNLVDGKPIYYWVNQHDLQVPSDAGCVLIVNSTAILARDLNLTKNGIGLLLAFSANCTIKNVNVQNNFMGIAYGWCDNTLVEGSSALNNAQFGFMVMASSRSNFTGNFASGNGYVSNQMGPGAGGIAVVNSNTTTVVDNSGENNSVGIALTYSSANNVTRNNIKDNGNGIFLQYSDDNEIINNLLLNNTEGIQLQWSHFNKVMNNSVTKSKSSGIDLSFSGGNMLKNNNLTDNKWNFGIWADVLADYINDVDNSNLVNNKPILYFVNQNNFTIDSSMFPQVGAIVIANSTNVTVQDVTLAGNFETLTFAFTNNSRIANVTIEDSWVSIFLHDANNNTILANMLRRNIMGPTLRRSNGNMIVGNTLTDNEYCIYLFGYSSNNLLIGNNLENSNFGLYVQQSSENTIYHNNFVNNTYPCRTYISPSNAWDNGSPSGGNYWSDYIGADSNHDGIGDSNHTIDANSNDRYPLMGMFTEFDATSERHVQTVCNSTISDFHFNGTAICFNASGQNGTTGFCRICIPRVLMNSTYEVFVNGTKVQSNELICSNGTHAYLYFNYTHSTKEVIIIPEFPSFSVVPMFMSATLLAVVFFKKKQKK